MEKNTIIALVLIFAVWILWALLSTPKQQQAPKQVERERETTASPTASPADSTETTFQKPSGTPSSIPRLKAEEKEIRVETPFYSAVFTNVGATIKSFWLKKYHLEPDPNSPLIELVNMGRSGENVLQIDFSRRSNPAIQKIIYHVEEDTLYLDDDSAPRDLVFRATIDGVSIDQIYRFYPDRYPIDLQVKLANKTETGIEGNLTAYLKGLPPDKKKSYYSFMGISLLLDDELQQFEPKKLKEPKAFSGNIGWMAYENGYFMSALVLEDQEKGRFYGQRQPSGIVEATFMTPPISLTPQNDVSSLFTIYLGPRDLSFLKPIGKKLDKAINFGWFDVIAKPLLHVLRFFYRYVKNYGLAIILLTILIKILFWPLTHKSYKSMKEMQKLQPLMAKIREKYKNNKQQMNKELMGLYKTYKVNPMGGCLPMVIQIPVFFALFRILGNSIELRHAPFMLWINDLSAPDRLGDFNLPQLPLMSPPYGIPVLTLLMGASMFIQQKMTPTPGDPAQAKIMMFLPIMFTFFFINFPSGLVLYWLINNVLSIGQQYRIKKSAA
jgi:YidC/Oxa1 family membrane protein insertase